MSDTSQAPIGPSVGPSVGTAAEVGAPVDIEPIGQEFRSAITDVLDEFIGRKQVELSSIGDDLRPLFTTARSYLESGKRLRPAFAYWGWRAAGGSAAKARGIYVAGAAIELVHASALVHDDLMDDSATRRGRPTAHRQFSDVRPVRNVGHQTAQFGQMAAILLGDMLLAWSDELLGQTGFKPKALARGRVYFDRLRTEVVAGQYLDVLAQTSGTTSVSDAMRVIRYKSAKYTVERPLQFGAALAKGSKPLLRALSSYGLPLGEAFQLRDDVLGVFGDPRETGKPAGDDIRDGKRTLLIARAYDRADKAQRKVLDANVGQPRVDARGIEAVQSVLRDTGAVAAVETVIGELTSAALAALAAAPIDDPEACRALEVLTDRATNRLV
ncbi:MAG TPA: polyprenyl synthetase family protein [Nocardioidaceae bacterium]|nr:polyprenyl synthetase family protein [Nocardioidaceae bacterium]